MSKGAKALLPLKQQHSKEHIKSKHGRFDMIFFPLDFKECGVVTKLLTAISVPQPAEA